MHVVAIESRGFLLGAPVLVIVSGPANGQTLEDARATVLDGLLEVLRPFGVLEMARTGRISMTRGGDLLQPPVEESSGSELESTGSNVK